MTNLQTPHWTFAKGALRLKGQQAKHISDVEILHVVEALCQKHDMWTFTGWVAECFPDFPEKVVAAKLSQLLKRGLVTGCDCGCRGDWELTTKGRELAGVAEPWRKNPMEESS